MQHLKPYLNVLVRRTFQQRPFSLSAVACQQNAAGKTPAKEAPPAEEIFRETTHQLTDFEKKVLVWTGKFKTIEDVPKSVHHETMERARNKFRIKICNYMILATILGCIAMIVTGKKKAERGETVSKMNMDWHKKYNEETTKSQG